MAHYADLHVVDAASAVHLQDFVALHAADGLCGPRAYVVRLSGLDHSPASSVTRDPFHDRSSVTCDVIGPDSLGEVPLEGDRPHLRSCGGFRGWQLGGVFGGRAGRRQAHTGIRFNKVDAGRLPRAIAGRGRACEVGWLRTVAVVVVRRRADAVLGQRPGDHERRATRRGVAGGVFDDVVGGNQEVQEIPVFLDPELDHRRDVIGVHRDARYVVLESVQTCGKGGVVGRHVLGTMDVLNCQRRPLRYVAGGAESVVRIRAANVPGTGREVDVHVAGPAGPNARAGLPVVAVRAALVALGAVPDIAYPQFWIVHAKRFGVFNQDRVGHVGIITDIFATLEDEQVLGRVDPVNQFGN